jgi:phosphoribosylaminoimidazole-succinocarboxamide synthase
VVVGRNSSIETGRTKRLHEDGPGTLVMEFLDEAILPDGRVKVPFKGKGEVCAAFSEAVFRYLESYNISHHFIESVGNGRIKVRRLDMLPLTVHVRNIAAGDMVERFSLQEGQVLDYPVIEHYLKRPGLAPTMVNPSHCLAFQLASDEELKALGRLASKVNAVLRSFFDRRDLILVDFTLEFGKDKGVVLVGDEISPDTCRLWDRRTRKKYDSDCFKSNMNAAEEIYREVLEKVIG